MPVAEADNAARGLARLLHAYLECDDEVQELIGKMLLIAHSSEADDQEKEAANLTVFEALFPLYGQDGSLGFSLDDGAQRVIDEQLDKQEERFAERVKKFMAKANMTQVELSKRIGVHQSAIAMMLKRNCRPQHRTIVKLAEALGVERVALWP